MTAMPAAPPYPRDLAGYGAHPPHPRWPGGARIALQFVLNYEEGAENCVLHGDPASETFLSEIMTQTHGFGFLSISNIENKQILERLNSRVKPTDLFTYGLIPEFTGRLPIIARFFDLTRDMLVRILIEPKESIYSQFKEIFRNEGVMLTVERKVFEQIADLAIEYKTGARSLRGIFEEMISPILYVVPDDPQIREVSIASLFTNATLTRGARAS